MTKKILEKYLTYYLSNYVNDWDDVPDESIDNPSFFKAAVLFALCCIADAIEGKRR